MDKSDGSDADIVAMMLHLVKRLDKSDGSEAYQNKRSHMHRNIHPRPQMPAWFKSNTIEAIAKPLEDQTISMQLPVQDEQYQFSKPLEDEKK